MSVVELIDIVCGCREQLSQLHRKHEQLLSDYHDLLVETDKKADKVRGSVKSLNITFCVFLCVSMLVFISAFCVCTHVYLKCVNKPILTDD